MYELQALFDVRDRDSKVESLEKSLRAKSRELEEYQKLYFSLMQTVCIVYNAIVLGILFSLATMIDFYCISTAFLAKGFDLALAYKRYIYEKEIFLLVITSISIMNTHVVFLITHI